MKKILLVVFGLLAVSVAGAQDNTDPAKKMKSQDMLMVDLNFDGWLNVPDSVKTLWYSRGVNVALVYDFPISTSRFSVALGVGISSHNVSSNARIVEQPDTVVGLYSVLVPFAEDYDYKRHKLSTTYGDIPVELRFKTKKDKHGYSFKFAIIGKVGYLLGVHNKTVDSEGKKKVYVFPNITENRYAIGARVGYGKVGITGMYSLTNLFEDGKGVKITPFSIGITILPF